MAGAIGQAGVIVPGHGGFFLANGQMADAGGSAGPGLTPANSNLPGSLPTGAVHVNSGQIYAAYSAYANGPYASFTWGFDGNGNALIEIAGIGGAPAPSLSFNINGQVYPFPGPGSGNVTGPGSSSVGHLPTWNSSGGTLLADPSGAFPSSFGSIPTTIAAINVGSYSTSNEIPAGVLQGIKSAMVIPSTYAGTPWPPANFAAYLLNGNSAGGSSSVGYFGFAGITSATASAWNFNSIITNANTFTPSNNTGLDFGLLVGLELDFNILKKSGGSQPAGEVDGIRIAGASQSGVQPASDTYAVHLLQIGSGVPWNFGFKTETGAATIGVDLGPIASGNGQQSQPIYLRSMSSGGVANTSIVTADSSANIVLDGTSVIGTVFNTLLNAAAYQIVGATVLARDTVGSTISLYDYAGNPAIILGATPGMATISYRNTNHAFEAIGGGTTFASIAATGGSGTTALQLEVNNNAGANLAAVTLGAVNSGGSGLRALCVAN